ncbi:hypothetical protein [Thermotalea metallivorans]|uniref:Uncharacterized protein n=1 Tax=Thermotalea metallivorans TaxID=520762 RepID=A0A140LA06_9FIRM|nr:hypothetical protein [Thermotalea metallivorans]KXG77381.1 hypothetical protein AN619_05070 [Thermotalea metallivorans]
MSFACCAFYWQCSQEEMCVNKYDHRDECDYQKKLEKGINFFKKNLYIEIQGRLFRIGKRRDYQRDTQGLSPQEQEEIKNLLKDDPRIWHERMIIEKCLDEKVSDRDRAVCRVFISIGDLKYNIHNYNGKAVTERTALMIRDYFREHGFGAAVEYVGSKVSKPINKKTKTMKTNENDLESIRKSNFDSKTKSLIDKQISFEEYLHEKMVINPNEEKYLS